MNYDISIIVSGIRNHNWIDLFNTIANGCPDKNFEVIFSGPNALPHSMQTDKRVKYIKNFSYPTKAFHMATRIAEGEFITWASDDGKVTPGSISLALDLLNGKNSHKDIVCMRYFESHDPNGVGQFPEEYWTTRYHTNFHSCPAVDLNWKLPIIMLISLERYNELGGLDCRFENINMNVHDLAFRAQRDGSEILMSPQIIAYYYCEPGRTPQNSEIIASFMENDWPLFEKMYDGTTERPIKIDLENWRDVESVWHRRKY